MKTLVQLLQTKRMFYLPMYNVNNLKGLYDMIQEIVKPTFEIVEVGSFAGVSSDLFARYCRYLYCVDVWNSSLIGNGIEPDLMQQGELMFDEVWKSHMNIEPVQGLSVDVAHQFPDESIDMVYIDSRHDYKSVKEDIEAWSVKVKKGGWITGHDYILMDVQNAIKDTIGEVKVYEDTSWARQK